MVVDQPPAMAAIGQIFGEKYVTWLDSLRCAFAIFELKHTDECNDILTAGRVVPIWEFVLS
jgi:hypothetical protein